MLPGLSGISGHVGVAASDPYFANVLLLAHMDGADASTTFTDSSTSARTLTAVGNAQIDTAQSKFGGASGLFDGTGDYVTAAYDANLAGWWETDFTIEGWVYVDVLKNEAGGAPAPMLAHGDPNGTTVYWAFGPISTGALRLYYFNGAATSVTSGTTPVSTGSWQHIAMTLSGSTIKLWHEGAEVASAALSGTPQKSASYPLIIGQINNAGHDGWIDEVRVTRGVARYTSAFTPTGPFPNS
jgi:hypothetical protein